MKRPKWTSGYAFLVLLSGLASGCQRYAFEIPPMWPPPIPPDAPSPFVPPKADILFVLDNSGSMAARQAGIARSFAALEAPMVEGLRGDYHIGLVTTGIPSEACPACPPDDPGWTSCINQTGEAGRFQDLLGHNDGTAGEPVFVFTQDRGCRLMDADNVDRCFYDPGTESGVVLAGPRGCGIERGLAAMRSALSEPLRDGYNTSAAGEAFLRDDAVLAVVLISDEEDCGEVGDVNETLQGVGGKVCYYAAKGVGPDGSYGDGQGRLYQLSPVYEYYDFLMGLKGGQRDLVRFAAIVGVEDPQDPETTEIRYSGDAPDADVEFACEVPVCEESCEPGDQVCANACHAYPGTRAVALAELFGLGEGGHGFVDTICQADFDATLDRLGRFIACSRVFYPHELVLDPELATLTIDGEPLPRYTCDGSTLEDPIGCDGPDDDSCQTGRCAASWTYHPPGDPYDSRAPYGWFELSDHFDACLLSAAEVDIGLNYVAVSGR